uniref:Uncharacterized protein n=1 Tax=Arundo donax TaxID=35708 RepID=A0A0A9B2G1_ARUDO
MYHVYEATGDSYHVAKFLFPISLMSSLLQLPWHVMNNRCISHDSSYQ